jgi:outer membrane murein-binding lipoprotein Lpp
MADSGQSANALCAFRSMRKKGIEMTPTRNIIATSALAIAGSLSLSACATEKYVDEHIATVNDRISQLEARVGQVDQTAQAANTTAQSAAAAAQSANQRLDALTARVDAIEQQLAAKKPRN